MPKTLGLIPNNFAIVDKLGRINLYFRDRWEELRSSFQLTPTVAEKDEQAKTAALATTTLYTTLSGARYRISYYLRKTIADGVSSSLTVTIGWTDRDGTALTEVFTALTTDTTSAHQSGRLEIYAAAATNITIAIAYASNTPNKMTWNYDAVVEQLA